MLTKTLIPEAIREDVLRVVEDDALSMKLLEVSRNQEDLPEASEETFEDAIRQKPTNGKSQLKWSLWHCGSLWHWETLEAMGQKCQAPAARLDTLKDMEGLPNNFALVYDNAHFVPFWKKTAHDMGLTSPGRGCLVNPTKVLLAGTTHTLSYEVWRGLRTNDQPLQTVEEAAAMVDSGDENHRRERRKKRLRRPCKSGHSWTSRNALTTCYWTFLPTPRSHAFFHTYPPMQKSVYVHFMHSEHTGPGIKQTQWKPFFCICTHIRYLLVVDHVVVVLVFRFF